MKSLFFLTFGALWIAGSSSQATSPRAVKQEPRWDESSNFFPSIRYVTLGASYTYGVGADDNVFGQDQYEPGSGGAYTTKVQNILRWVGKVNHLNAGIPGQTSGQILATQAPQAIEFLLNSDSQNTVIELASGGNDLLGFLLFPRNLPPQLEQARDLCFDTEPTPGAKFPELYILQDSAECDAAVSQILANAENNIANLVDELQSVAPHNAKFLLRNFPNPLLATPEPFEGATCQELIERPDYAYGVSLPAATVNKFLNGGFLDGVGSGFVGLNGIIANVAAAKGATLVDINGTVDGTKTFRDCIHPSQGGHDAIAWRVFKSLK